MTNCTCMACLFSSDSQDDDDDHTNNVEYR